jgi:hypothetical protein
MRFAPDHDVVQAFSLDRADQSLHMGFRRGDPGCNCSTPDADSLDPIPDDSAVGAVPVPMARAPTWRSSYERPRTGSEVHRQGCGSKRPSPPTT